MDLYRKTAAARQRMRHKRLDERHAHAWDVARQAARLLRDAFGATRVVVFGSLLERSLFHERSDVDLAAWGISEERYLSAVSRLLSLDSQVDIDLIRVEEATERLLSVIEQEGASI